jgi:WD40 repeat protein
MIGISEIAISSENSLIALSNSEGKIYVWDIKNNKEICQFNSTFGFGGKRLAITNDGKYVATGSWGRKGLALYNSIDGSIVWKRKDLSKIQTVKITPNDKYIFVSIDNRYLLKIELATGEILEKLKGFENIFFSNYDNVYILEDSKQYNKYIIYSKDKETSSISKETSALDICFAPGITFITEVCEKVRAINYLTGDEIWRFDPNAGVPRVLTKYPSGSEGWDFAPDTGSHFLTIQYNRELNVLYGLLWPSGKGSDKTLYEFNANTGEIRNKIVVGESFTQKFDDYGKILIIPSASGFDLYDLSQGIKNLNKKKLRIY